MEAFLLNAGSAAQKVSPAQSGPGSSAEDAGDFSPVMEEAIQSVEATDSSQNQTQGSPQDDNTTNSAVTSQEDAKSASVGDDFPATKTSEQLLNQGTLFTVLQAVTAEVQGATLVQGNDKGQVPPSLQSPSPVIPPQPETGDQQLTSTNRAESILLKQIQQIIDQGKDNGTITISIQGDLPHPQKGASDNLQGLTNPLLTETKGNPPQTNQLITAPSEDGSLLSITTTNTKEAAKTGIPLAIVDGNTKTSQKIAKFEGGQQDLTEQYLNAKIGDSKAQEGKTFQQQNQDSKGSEQNAKNELQPAISQNIDTTLSATKTAESGFGQQLSVTQSTTTTPLGLEAKMTPGSTLHVPGRELLDNLIHRFNVNPRLQTSRISLQLHPAELGSLKIDILVQGDSIKTNIVAQSQQVMDTLDKNMPRLREVLQAQGFTVDAFEITLESDGGNQQGLFQEHFGSQQQEFTSSGSSSNGSESFDALFDPDPEADTIEVEKSGVNLTA